jgi:hypothetical protein
MAPEEAPVRGETAISVPLSRGLRSTRRSSLRHGQREEQVTIF